MFNGKLRGPLYFIKSSLIYWSFFPQQQNAMGSLHNIDFGVCWASWGGSGKNGFRESSGRVPGKFQEPFREQVGLEVPGTGFKVRISSSAGGSRNRFRELVGLEVPGTGSKQGLDRFQGSRVQEPVPRFRGSKNHIPGTVPGTGSDGFRGLGRLQGSEVPGRFQWFRDVGTGFREPKVLRRFRIPEIRFPRFKYTFVLRKSTVVLWKYTFVIWKCTFVLWKYTFALGM